MAFYTKLKLGIGLLLALGVLSMTGCMVNPLNNEHLGYYYGSTNKAITPAGYVSKPNLPVTVEAWDWKSKRWVTFATTKSSNVPYYWDGRTWYYWQTKPTRFGTRMWNSYWGEAKAKLRAVAEGNSLYTFDEYNFNSTSTLGDVADGVNGLEITVHGWQFEIDP